MANLIITVIAIALVAVASLMGAYYGGSAFLNGQAGSYASALLSEGTQVQGAFATYLSANLNNPPTAWSDMITQGYVREIPLFPNVGTNGKGANMGISLDGSGTYWLWGDIGEVGNNTPDPNAVVCNAIIKAVTGKVPAAIPASGVTHSLLTGSAATGSGNGTTGCVHNQDYLNDPTSQNIMTDNPGVVPDNHYAFFYRLN
jgi:hypothetical protein